MHAFDVGAVYAGETVDFWFKQAAVVVEAGGCGQSGRGLIGRGRLALVVPFHQPTDAAN